MKEKECKIIQDLLPNYIENLTSVETNEFIENHFEECKDCKRILENMQSNKDYEENKNKKHEIKYMKKFNVRLKILRNILILIAVLFIIIIGRKTYILEDISNKVNKVKNENNYYEKTEAFYNGEMVISETYFKDDRALVTRTTYSQNGKVIKQKIYKSKKENFIILDDGNMKKLINVSEIALEPLVYTEKSFLQNLTNAFSLYIEKVKLEDKECYLIKELNMEKFIDVETGKTLKIIYNDINCTTNYEVQYGVVKDEDIERPDVTDCIIIN